MLPPWMFSIPRALLPVMLFRVMVLYSVSRPSTCTPSAVLVAMTLLGPMVTCCTPSKSLMPFSPLGMAPVPAASVPM